MIEQLNIIIVALIFMFVAVVSNEDEIVANIVSFGIIRILFSILYIIYLSIK